MFWFTPEMAEAVLEIQKAEAKREEYARNAFLRSLDRLDPVERQRRIERREDIERQERHHLECLAAIRGRYRWT